MLVICQRLLMTFILSLVVCLFVCSVFQFLHLTTIMASSLAEQTMTSLVDSNLQDTLEMLVKRMTRYGWFHHVETQLIARGLAALEIRMYEQSLPLRFAHIAIDHPDIFPRPLINTETNTCEPIRVFIQQCIAAWSVAPFIEPKKD